LAHHGSVLLLKVIVVPEGQPLSNGVTEARRVRAELDQAIAASGPTDAPIRPLVTVAYALNAGMQTAASEHNASLLLLGWHEESSSSERLFGPPIEEVLRRPPCDVAVVRLHGNTSWRRVLLPVRGGPHTPLACDMALALSETADAEITVLYASDPRRADDVAARESLQSLRTMPRVSRCLERAISA
jgi:glucosyl-3-phosphoglycerate synthase